MREWEQEPDFKALEFEGMQARIRRSRMGTLCGYVGLPVRDLEEDPTMLEDLMAIHAHGAWTCIDNVDLGEPEYFWVGFDCMHKTDLIPPAPEMAILGEEVCAELDAMLNFHPEKRVYRTIGYVEQTLDRVCREFRLKRKRRLRAV